MTFASLGPIASDGKPFTLPNIFPGEVLLNFAGRPDSGGVRYAGDLFGLTKEGIGSQSVDFSFQDGVYLAGGDLMWRGGGFGSYIKMEVYAPATTLTDPDPPNTGNANLVSTGLGFNIIVPAAGDGAKNLGSIVVPVPAIDDESNAEIGYWSYSDPWIGKGQVSAGTPQASKYNLFDATLPLARYIDINLVTEEGSRQVVLHNIKPKWVLPEWFFRVTAYNIDNAKTLQVSWNLAIARKKSV